MTEWSEDARKVMELSVAESKEKYLKSLAIDTQLKENVLKLVKEHKENCPGSECDISISLVRTLLAKASIKLSEEERMLLV